MRFLLVSMRITLIRLLRDRAFWLVTLLMWAALLAGCLYLGQDASIAVVRAGFLYHPQDGVAQQVYDELPSHPMVEFVFFPPEQEDEMAQQVQTGELECAYILREDFGANVEARGLVEAVEVVVSPRTVADAILSELVFSAALNAYAPYLTTDIISSVFRDTDRNFLYDEVTEQFHWYETEGVEQFLQQHAQSVGAGAGQQQAGATARRPIHGIMALMLLAMNLFLAPRFIGEKSPGLWRRLGGGRLCQYYGSVAGSLWLVNLLAVLPALLLVRAVYPPALGGMWWELAALVLYALALCVFTILFAVWMKGADLLFAASIFVLLLALLLGGVLFDWTEINATLAALSKWTVTERYISIAIYQDIGSMYLLGWASVAGILATWFRFAAYAVKGRY